MSSAEVEKESKKSKSPLARPFNFMLVLDEHGQRDTLVTEAAMAMYNPAEPRRCLVEPPFQVESHRYQTMQAADWITGLVGAD